MKGIKELTQKSQNLEKKTAKNKGLAEKRKDNLAKLEETARLLEEEGVGFESGAKQLEQHYTKKYRKFMIAIGVIVGSLLTYGFSGYLFADSDNSSDDY